MLPRLLILLVVLWRASPESSEETQKEERSEKNWLVSLWEFFFPRSLIDSFERDQNDRDSVDTDLVANSGNTSDVEDDAAISGEENTSSLSPGVPHRHNITQTRVKHTCTPYKGCTPELNCTDFSQINDSNLVGITDQGGVVGVNLTQLQYLLEDVTHANSCVLVMFYIVWCQHSVDFAPIYNKLGVVFPQMPVVAMDFGLFSPDRYLLAYVPRVILYFSGRVVYDIDTTMAVENLTEILANMTGLNPKPIPTDSEMSDHPSPLPTEVEESNSMLWLSIAAVVIILTVNFIHKSEACANCRDRTARALHLKTD